MDWFSFIIALLGLIIPLASTILNNDHQAKINLQNNNCKLNLNTQSNEQALKSKELEYLYSGKFQSLSDYLDNLITYLEDSNNVNLKKYKLSMAKVCMFVSENLYDYIEEINLLIDNNKLTTAEMCLYNELLPAISTDSFIQKKK